jgi:hypothetical protein
MPESGQSNLMKSRSVALGHDRDNSEMIRQSNYVRSQSVTAGHRRDNSGRMMGIFDIPSPAAAQPGTTDHQETSSSPKSPSGSDHEWGDGLGLGRSPSGSGFSSTSSPRRVVDVTLSSWNEANEFSAPSPGSGYSRISYVEVGSPLLPQSPRLVSSVSTKAF